MKKKPARFVQIVEIQSALYALDEEGKVWRYGEDSSGPAWLPLSDKRCEERSIEPDRPVGF